MCIFENLHCDSSCPIYRLFRQYRECQSLISNLGLTITKCDNLLIILVENINNNLMQVATYKYIKHAFYLISNDYFPAILNVIGYKLYLNLCVNSLIASIVLGVPEPITTLKILQYFEIVLNMKKSFMILDEFINLKNNYYLLLFQVLQLKKESSSYQHVITTFASLDSKIPMSEQKRRVVAQVTASQYLLGRLDKNTKLIINSRDSIYSIYDNLDNSNLTPTNYFVMAKLLEHHTETYRYSDVQEVVKELEQYLEKSLSDEVVSLEEAVNKVIFHRDAYRALRMIDDERCIKHLSIAEEIANEYNLVDQLNKIIKIRNEWEYVELHDDKRIKTTLKTKCLNLNFEHKCNMKKPYIFISYSHKDANLIKIDIYRYLSKLNYWIDYENLDGGRCSSEDDWTKKIIPVLSNELCKGVIVYCSPYSVRRSIGALREAEWLEKNRIRNIYVLLCDFSNSFTPEKASQYLETIDVEDSIYSLRIKTAFSYILQATQNKEKYSYYFYDENGGHLRNSYFLNWIKKIIEID